MSKIEELLQKLCPDGVPMVKLKDLFDTRNGYTPSTSNNEFWEGGTIPWFKMEDIRDHGHILSDSYAHITPSAIKGKGLFKANSIILATSATIGEHAIIKVPHLSNQRFTNLYPKKEYESKINMAFAYHFMFIVDRWCKEHTIQGNFAGVNMTELYEYKFPLPPLEVQEEIVRVLDSFASLQENLEQELTLRRKQYEHYRETLLTFGDDVPTVKISDVADCSTGLTYKPENVKDEGTLVLRSSNIKNGRLSFEDNVFVDMIIPERSKVKINDILICVRNGSKALVGKCAMITQNVEGIAFGAFMNILRAKSVVPKYLFYVWQSDRTYRQYKGDEGAPINQITNRDFNRIKIPLPPLEVQEEIVRVLDKFEALIENIEKELELRRKQYEFYREKLLTF